jgi:cell division septation protein DedD
MEQVKQSRRQLLKMGTIALVAAPMMGLSSVAFAKKNDGVRAALKFQNHPNGEKQCSKCMNFIPNKDKPTDAGAVHGCKLYPGDDEINFNGYCTGFVAKPK